MFRPTIWMCRRFFAARRKRPEAILDQFFSGAFAAAGALCCFDLENS